jgi:hypothetical protein
VVIVCASPSLFVTASIETAAPAVNKARRFIIIQTSDIPEPERASDKDYTRKRHSTRHHPFITLVRGKSGRRNTDSAGLFSGFF